MGIAGKQRDVYLHIRGKIKKFNIISCQRKKKATKAALLLEGERAEVPLLPPSAQHPVNLCKIEEDLLCQDKGMVNPFSIKIYLADS